MKTEKRDTCKNWKLVGPDGKLYTSAVPGTLGGHRRSRIYGRLNCPSALRAIARGGYVTHRVFFLNAQTARAAGYRPCAVCLSDDYSRWRDEPGGMVKSRLVSLRLPETEFSHEPLPFACQSDTGMESSDPSPSAGVSFATLKAQNGG